MIIMKQLHSEWGNVGSWGIGASRATPTANVWPRIVVQHVAFAFVTSKHNLRGRGNRRPIVGASFDIINPCLKLMIRQETHDKRIGARCINNCTSAVCLTWSLVGRSAWPNTRLFTKRAWLTQHQLSEALGSDAVFALTRPLVRSGATREVSAVQDRRMYPSGVARSRYILRRMCSLAGSGS